ncbi:hypothetical protein GCM10020369_01560 [Cryptosporangium minutisporangium]|uniref:Uncharacterized protein n=1 Tax=Cryptosporangium minutisporangium TaxID=113569 RepID=A0ABP6SQ76_9ACTN
MGNSTAVPAAAAASPSPATSKVGAMAMTAAPAAATDAPTSSTVRAWAASSPPNANRVIATVPANTAGATALIPAPEWSTSWAKTALQLWCAFSLANASAPSTPTRRSGTSGSRPGGAASGAPERWSDAGATPAGSVFHRLAVATRERSATATNGIASGSSAADANPVPRLPRTTRLEKIP